MMSDFLKDCSMQTAIMAHFNLLPMCSCSTTADVVLRTVKAALNLLCVIQKYARILQ